MDIHLAPHSATVTITADRDILWLVLLAAQTARRLTAPDDGERIRRACAAVAAQITEGE